MHILRKSLLLLLIGTGFVARSQSTFTLDQCLTAAEGHLPLARQQPLIEASHQAAMAQLRANYLPQAILGAQATWQTAVTQVPISFPGVDIPTISKDQYRATLELTESIWDGGQLAGQMGIQKAQTDVELQRLQVDQYSTREQTFQLYCAALLAQQQQEMLGAMLNDIDQRRQRASEQVANGAAIPAQVQAFEARQIELRQQQAEANWRRQSAIDGLALLTGLSITKSDVLAQPVVAAAPSGNNRPELKLFALQQRSAQAQENVIRAKTMPRINAIATLGYGRPGLNMLSNNFDPYGIFGVNARWNLSGLYTGSASKERQQARLLSQRIAAQQAQFELQTDVKSSQSRRDIERLEEILSFDKQVIALRESIAATAAVQLENGVLTPSEYLIESTNVATAKLNQSLHQTQLLQAQLQLAFIQGKL